MKRGVKHVPELCDGIAQDTFGVMGGRLLLHLALPEDLTRGKTSYWRGDDGGGEDRMDRDVGIAANVSEATCGRGPPQ